MGQLLMVDNQKGGVGIVPKAKGAVVSQWANDSVTEANTPAAILAAVNYMKFGDILLLEAQETDPVSGTYFWPLEVGDANYAAIRLATALGITVIEAACNGSFDLDPYVNLDGKHIFNRSYTAEFRDSGAVVVGAGSSVAPAARLWFSNFGSRVDVFGWGEHVDTTYTDDAGSAHNLYTAEFSGTSSASPIVTGAAAAVQGLAVAALGFPLAPLQVRRLLAAGGTRSANPAADRIGVMPNLKAIIDGNFVALTPDLFIRDFVGDPGGTAVNTAVAVSASPDIIVRQKPVASPQAAFGAGSGTEQNGALSEPVVAGRDHSVYVRVANRGGSTAGLTTVEVFVAEAATLVTPGQWRSLGEVSLPTVPPGSLLTVAPALTLPAAAVPRPGAYSLIAVAKSAADPLPGLPASFPDWTRFVQANNNAAWASVSAVAPPPAAGAAPTPDAVQRFPVKVAGAADRPRRFALSTSGSLPAGSDVRLDAPAALARALGVVLRDSPSPPAAPGAAPRVSIPLAPVGRSDVGEGPLPVGFAAACELQVRVPAGAAAKGARYEFALAQAWEGKEVGRVTFPIATAAATNGTVAAVAAVA